MAAAATVMSACDETPTSPSQLIGETWRLVSIDRTGSTPLVPQADRRFTIEFLDTGRVAVHADCNSCSGSYELTDGRLTIRPLACTRAFCGTDSLDTPFLQALTAAKTVQREESQLSIQAENVTLRFSRD